MTKTRTYLSLAIRGISKRNIVILAIFICLFLFSSLTYAQDISQVVSNLDEILKANPLEPGATKAQITKFEDDTATVLVIQNVVGLVLKPHFHKTHSETIYVAKGSGQIFSNDKENIMGRPCFYVLHSKRENDIDQPCLVKPASMPRVPCTMSFAVVSSAARSFGTTPTATIFSSGWRRS
jgi:hypothetical protein